MNFDHNNEFLQISMLKLQASDATKRVSRETADNRTPGEEKQQESAGSKLFLYIINKKTKTVKSFKL